ncbi:RsmE family RNA methyltransferase [Paraflavitalea sp. CAU 1676]|uniref:RsmE family RNA methyltransferase n=1 Tax=Paraflavitalea sp. CAU 1676 TaxID=3032598 RepID=UPI0023DBC84D|nr:RsmE family RNA methyltransferase [Paraflavitalea sp. CAU 1676]MDF2187436.1 RsmE family RNA methyltransferase [Paraflavitalea sp. CAU 1676]
MSLPIFYIESAAAVNDIITLPEEASKHIIQVLRKQVGELVQLTDGVGNLLTAEIINDHKKKCGVRINDAVYTAPAKRRITVAISLLKNASRFEWFLEKATEIGVQSIIPLLCDRTEREHFRHDRMQGILVSAMLQSQQSWLPELHQPVAYEQLFRLEDVMQTSQKFIAHCIDSDRRELQREVSAVQPSQIILIGPEGDFTQDEIALALQHQFMPVVIGHNRLRTETAGVVAASLLKIV